MGTTKEKDKNQKDKYMTQEPNRYQSPSCMANKLSSTSARLQPKMEWDRTGKEQRGLSLSSRMPRSLERAVRPQRLSSTSEEGPLSESKRDPDSQPSQRDRKEEKTRRQRKDRGILIFSYSLC